MEKIVWSNGSKFERTKRVDKNENIKTENNTIEECLENNCMLNEINRSIFSKSEKDLNDREINFNKINEREMYAQKGLNPFLVNNNYLNDIDNSNKYLMSINTSEEKE